MKIAIDESGDTGRRFRRGSTPWFVVAAVVVPDTTRECGLTCDVIQQYKRNNMSGGELHFAHNSHTQHAQFLEYMQDKEFLFVSVAVDKRKMLRRKPHVAMSKRFLFQHSLDKLFSELHQHLDNPVVLMDKNGRRIDRTLRRHMLRLFGPKHKGDWRSIKNIVFVDSRREPLVQLADYVAGAVRHHVDKRYNSESYDKYLADKGKIFYL